MYDFFKYINVIYYDQDFLKFFEVFTFGNFPHMNISSEII